MSDNSRSKIGLTENDKTSIATIVTGAVASSVSGSIFIGAFASIGTIAWRRKPYETYKILCDIMPENMRLFLPAVKIAYETMCENLDRCVIEAPNYLLLKEEEITSQLSVLHTPENMLLNTTEFRDLYKAHKWGVGNEKDISLLKEIKASGVILKIDCQSICVGAYATLVSMRRRYQSSFIIDPSGASGKEQSQRSDSDADIMITADAPMILGQKREKFKKRFTVTTQLQSIFRKKGTPKGKQRTFIYPDSSVTHQEKLVREQRLTTDFQFPHENNNIIINDLSDYIKIDALTQPGDYVVAWNPLRLKLLYHRSFEEVKDTGFALPISLYVNERQQISNEHLEAFIRLFIAEMNHVNGNRVYSCKFLLEDSKFRESFIRGAGLRIY